MSAPTRLFIPFTVVLLFSLPSAAAGEQAGTLRLPDLVVTVRKWLEAEVDVPQSVTVIPAETVEVSTDLNATLGRTRESTGIE